MITIVEDVFLSRKCLNLQCLTAWHKRTIPNRFERQVPRYPDNLAIKTDSEELTYKDLNEAANQVAIAVVQQIVFGAEPIGLLFDQDSQTITAIFGALKAGKIFVPLDPSRLLLGSALWLMKFSPACYSPTLTIALLQRNFPIIGFLRDIGFQSSSRCRVDSGSWVGPYTGKAVGDPGKFDVDHMVPLANAHRSGGWAWTPKSKAAYANYLEYPG